ncbi:hypothetical protein BD309DRAFT_953505 [Dichomitus squalens]|nr:hypothetical protein BD309DRAFT_953505 [Dichomitus squalens]
MILMCFLRAQQCSASSVQRSDNPRCRSLERHSCTPCALHNMLACRHYDFEIVHYLGRVLCDSSAVR